MSTRASILATLRKNRPTGDFPLPPPPDFAPLVEGDPAQIFGERLERMGGRTLRAADGPDPLAPVRETLDGARSLASAVREVAGNRDLRAVAKPGDLEDVDVAVVRAAFGVAETGSVLFTERELIVNAVAYRWPDFGDSAYAVFHTGPSATADIEGVLIHGAQGVRSLTVVLLPRTG